MEFPLYQPPYLGKGMVIGLNAVIHVFLSHGVAIGAFAFLTWSDWLSWKQPGAPGEAWGRFSRRLLRFVVLAVTIAGAVTGVGIWLTISALAPRATGSMLRIFFWPWFLEFQVFVIEVLFLLWLYKRWDGLERQRKRRFKMEVGYVVFAIASAIAITGILGFMLTPGAWVGERTLGSAFFNPSFLPQLMSRLSFSFALGALITLAFAAFWKEALPVRKQAFVRFGIALLISVILLAVSVFVYFLRVPIPYTERTRFSVLTSNFSQWPELLLLGNAVTIGLVIATAVAGARGQVKLTRILVIPGLIGMLAWITQFERVREFIRGPYLMPGYLYANGVLVEEGPRLNLTGMLPASAWHNAGPVEQNPMSAGAFLFARNCSGCHTVDGLNSITDRLRGRSEDGIRVLLDRTHRMVSFMPPFSGNQEERRATARFLHDLTRDDLRMESKARFRVKGSTGAADE